MASTMNHCLSSRALQTPCQVLFRQASGKQSRLSSSSVFAPAGRLHKHCSTALPCGKDAPARRQSYSHHRRGLFRAPRAVASSPAGGEVKAAAAAPSGKGQMLVYVPPHPLVKHWMAVLRNEMTPSPTFKNAMAELGRILIYEASRDWLPMVEGEVQTPCGVASVEFIDGSSPIKVVPVLRAGLVLIEQVSMVLPLTETYHLGFSRDETTLLPSLYLDKVPKSFPPGARVLVADPMLATGGTAAAALELLISRGADVNLMRFISVIAAPPALKLLSEKFPGLKVYTAIIDPGLNDKGFIVPGLGDAGDRSFGTA
eukprot:TRINITY_DN19593_c0_g1_i1.p1 TRINITY_DN19593_c0_g1~~TRINITY_DN19593_c0_g1_i1.p1  ORF type:complete len:314 (-),score=27.62 TRINITY_DN19593_c0_g1_i1:1054-1995(-)